MKELKFNLGGIGKGGQEYKTVNLAEICDIDANIMDLDSFCKDGGTIKVIQTDIGRLIKMWTDGQITFRTMRAPIFTPATRCDSNILQQHQSMWSQEELIKDFNSIGMKAEGFDAGHWQYDVEDDIIPEETKKDFGKDIPNLGVIATK
jgi:hypothetical protein